MRYLKFLLILLFSVKVCFAQQPVFKNLSINEGLPSSTVYKLYQDKKGYMWVSTDAGLGRYNGHGFDMYNRKDSLGNDIAFALTEDKKGNIWMSCFREYLMYFDGKEYKTVAANDSLKADLRRCKGIIMCLAFDEADTLWVGTTRKLYKIPPSNNYGTLIQDMSFKDSALCVIKEFKDGRTLEALHNGHTQKITNDDKYNTFFNQIQNSNKKYSKLIKIQYEKTKTGNPKFASCKLQNGALLFSYLNEVYIQQSNGTISKKTFEADIINLYEDSEGNIWISLSGQGVHFFEKGNLNKKAVLYFENYTVTSIVQDFEGGIWLGTADKGVFYTAALNYFQFTNEPGLSDGIKTVELIDSLIFVANNKNEIFIINPDMSIKKMPSINPVSVSNHFRFYKLNNKIVACCNKTAEFDLKTLSVKYHSTNTGKPVVGTCMIQLPDGRIEGIAQGNYYSVSNGVWTKKHSSPGRDFDMEYDADTKRILIGTNSGMFALKDTTFTAYEHPVLATEVVYNFYRDKTKMLYVGTSRGMFYFKDNIWNRIGVDEGLPSRLCYNMYCDSNNTVWMTSKRGITFFNWGDSKKLTTLTSADGLPTNETRTIIGRGDLLYVVCKGPLFIIDRKAKLTDNTPPKIYISNITVNDSVVENRDTVYDYTNNCLKFFIDCISFKKMFGQEYKYRLVGFEDSLKLSSNDYVVYPNLAPGSYTFEVYGLSDKKVVSEQKAVYVFTIGKPFWLTWWFVVLEILAGAGILYLFIKWRVDIVRASEQEKNRMNKLVADSRIAAIQAQMNPHFIFNTINSIQDFILQNDTQKAYDYLAKFAKLVRTILNNSQENLIKLEKELDTLKLYVEIEQLRFKNNFEFVLNTEGLTSDANEIKIPGMLIQPYIENAIWHGIMPLEKNKKGKLILSLKQENNELHIRIEDNGVGRGYSADVRKTEGHVSMGDKLVQEKIEMIGRMYNKKASTITTDLFDENKKPMGTRIDITLPLLFS